MSTPDSLAAEDADDENDSEGAQSPEGERHDRRPVAEIRVRIHGFTACFDVGLGLGCHDGTTGRYEAPWRVNRTEREGSHAARTASSMGSASHLYASMVSSAHARTTSSLVSM